MTGFLQNVYCSACYVFWLQPVRYVGALVCVCGSVVHVPAEREEKVVRPSLWYLK